MDGDVQENRIDQTSFKVQSWLIQRVYILEVKLLLFKYNN